MMVISWRNLSARRGRALGRWVTAEPYSQISRWVSVIKSVTRILLSSEDKLCSRAAAARAACFSGRINSSRHFEENYSSFFFAVGPFRVSWAHQSETSVFALVSSPNVIVIENWSLNGILGENAQRIRLRWVQQESRHLAHADGRICWPALSCSRRLCIVCHWLERREKRCSNCSSRARLRRHDCHDGSGNWMRFLYHYDTDLMYYMTTLRFVLKFLPTNLIKLFFQSCFLSLLSRMRAFECTRRCEACHFFVMSYTCRD